MSLSQIQGLVELGMFSDALHALDQLPSDLRKAPAALRMQARSRAATGDWNGARETAEVLRHGNALDREEAASCFQSLAAEHFKHGLLDAARSMIERSIGTRPEQRALILDDGRFTEKFLQEFQPPARQEQEA